MKVYKVEDLAQYNRVVEFDGHTVKFDGHWATVPQELIYYFNRIDDFQVGLGQELVNSIQSQPVEEEIAPGIEPETKGTATISPNIKEITQQNSGEEVELEKQASVETDAENVITTPQA